MTKPPSDSRPQVLLIAPQIPPYGGMALQADLLQRFLTRDGISAQLIPSNPVFPSGLAFTARVPVLSAFVRASIFATRLWKSLPRADVVHIFACSWVYFFLIVWPTVAMSRFCKKRIVLNYRGGEARQFFRSFGWVAGFVLKRADVITTPSEFLAEVIRNSFGLPVSIVPNILDITSFKYRQRNEIQPKLLVTRHLEKIYDIESVLRAFRAVQKNHPDASLWIAGTGDREKHLRQLSSTWNLMNVRFLGHVSHEDLPAVYDQCHIYINASLVDNFPGALLEASASGLVVVSTSAGGIRFLYQNEGTALLVSPGDAEGLAFAVERVLGDSQLAHRLAREGAAMVQRCEWQQVRTELYSAYGFLEPKPQEAFPGCVSAEPASMEGC